MTVKRTDNTDLQQVTVRIDLTSQDIRTGVVRLPRQLHNALPPGDLTATTDDGAELQLVFTPPRELSGLQDYLLQHELRPNDAIVLHVRGHHLTVEPFQRSRPEPEPPAAAPDDATMLPGLFGDMPAVKAVEAEPAGPSDPEAPDPDLQAALFTPDGYASEPESAEDALTADKPAETDLFAAFGATEEDYFEDDFDIPAMPAWTPPTADGSEAGPSEPLPEVSPQSEPSAFHTVQRRSFVPPAARRAAPAPAAAGNAAAEAQAATEPAAVATAGQASPGSSAASRVRAHVDDPATPSIVRASELSKQLGLELSAVEQALLAISQEPESRLSSIRPDYWLLKRRPTNS